MVGYAVLTLHQILKSSPLTPETSVQLGELIALNQGLQLSEEQKVNIYTDSKYDFLVLHAHAVIWKERNYVLASKSTIKYHKEIDELLSFVNMPS